MTSQAPIHLATRGSKPALTQTRRVIARLRQCWLEVAFEVVVIRTTGDRVQVGGKGLFTKELEEALLQGRADLAVHSAKDLPTEPAVGAAELLIACYPERADPRDALALSERLCQPTGAGLEALPEGAQVGTSSPRRQAQLRHARPDLSFVDLRGNLDTRLRKLAQQGLDAVVLAAAGLSRLGLRGLDARLLPLEVCLPAAGQGALAVEARRGDERVLKLLAPLDNHVVRLTVTAERACLRELQCGCQTPVAAHAWLEGEEVVMRGVVASPDGERLVRAQAQGPMKEPEAIGKRLAAELLAAGADRILREIGGRGA